MQGWECPKCGYCYSYIVRECSNCNKPFVSYGSTHNVFINTKKINDPVDECNPLPNIVTTNNCVEGEMK